MSEKGRSLAAVVGSFGIGGAVPGLIFVTRLGTWEQALDKGPFVVVVPSVLCAAAGLASAQKLLESRTRGIAAAWGALIGVVCIALSIAAFAAYFAFIDQSRSGSCRTLSECITIGLVISAVGGTWALPILGVVAGATIWRRQTGRRPTPVRPSGVK